MRFRFGAIPSSNKLARVRVKVMSRKVSVFLMFHSSECDFRLNKNIFVWIFNQQLDTVLTNPKYINSKPSLTLCFSYDVWSFNSSHILITYLLFELLYKLWNFTKDYFFFFWILYLSFILFFFFWGNCHWYLIWMLWILL